MNLKIVFIFIGLMISQFFNGETFSQAIGKSDYDAARKSQGFIDKKIKEIHGSEEIKENNLPRDNYGGINSESNDCNQSNLSQEQLVECEFQKTQNSTDWSADLTTEEVIQNFEDQENAEKELKRLEEEKIRARKMKEIEEKKVKFEMRKANRNDRGKWGLNFRMTQNEAFNICKLDSSECYKTSIMYTSENCNRHVFFDEEFVDSICKSFGPYSHELWDKIEKKLKSKYKLLISSKSEDLKAVLTLDRGATFFALYTNDLNNKDPIYIEMLTYYSALNSEYLLYVVYHSENMGKEIIKKYAKKEQIIDDL